ncbi:MAG TPA: hypothetical protein V6C97_01725 [Oculatellaceae cyanobacterium]
MDTKPHHETQKQADHLKHVTPQQIHDEAFAINKWAEAGTPEDKQNIHKELERIKKVLSAEQYGQLLKEIQADNEADVKANPHLPKLTLVSSDGSGVADTIEQNWDK